MAVYEKIQFFHRLDVEEYLDILKKEYEAREHPKQAGAYLVGDPEIPFYKPKFMGDYISILSFKSLSRFLMFLSRFLSTTLN